MHHPFLSVLVMAVTSKVGCVSFGVIATRALVIPGNDAWNKFPWLRESQEESIWQEKKSSRTIVYLS